MDQTIVMGGGCFWCIDAVMRPLKGVKEVVSGYAGGETKNPSYEEVCSGTTGHAEVVQVTFDSETVSLEQLLKVFFTLHDPTTLNRQGADAGTQYRSVVYYTEPEQREIILKVMEEIDAEGVWEDPLVTEVASLDIFYPAEEYHQDYFAKNPDKGYCQVVIAPKVSKLRKEYLSILGE
jgi:peptide-methionine (S)-S-oxide reductase